MLGKLLTYVQYAFYAIVFFGDQIFAYLKVTPPAIYQTIKAKKMLAFFLVMFLGNNIQNMLTSTGAFEITLNGDLLFSKIHTGRMPTLEEIDELIKPYY